MAEKYLSPQSYQWIGQQGLLRVIDASTGPEGPHGTTSYFLVPANGYHGGQRIPHTVNEDLKAQKYDKQTIEGVDYLLIPEEGTNVPGRLSHYAQLTGVAELQNPPSGGVNRVNETLENTAAATVDPEGVQKYVKDHDSFEDARQKKTEEDERVARQVSVSPAREPAEGKLVVADQADTSGSSSKSTGASKASSEKQVNPTGETKV